MAYNPKIWVTGETITAEDLNHLEQGVANEQVGPAGAPGEPGADGKDGKDGADGKSAYQISVDNGFTGTETEWLASLKGADGQDGVDGATGAPGAPGEDGAPGKDGKDGKDGVGVPAGGAAGQILAKKTATDYDTQWIDQPGGGGGGAAGVSSFNGRTGAVVPGNGDYTAAMVGARPDTWTPTAEQVSFERSATGMTAENVQDAISELFTSGSEGKALIASAITAKGVDTAADATFQTMQENILAISSVPEGLRTITLEASPADGGTVSGGGMASDGTRIAVLAIAAAGFKFESWQGAGLVVSQNSEYIFTVSSDKTLKALFLEYVFSFSAAALPSSANWADVTFGDGTFVAVAYGTNKAAYSTDGGKTWAAATLPYIDYWQCVAYGNGLFVTISKNKNNAAIAYSEDGKTWTSGSIQDYAWQSVTYGNGIFVAIAYSSNMVAYSTTGISWQLATMPSSSFWNCVCFGDGAFIAFKGNSSIAAYSKDAKAWEDVTLPSSNWWRGAAYGDGVFVVVAGSSSNKAAYSTDGGKTWAAATLPSSADWSGVSYVNGTFIAVAGSSSNKAAYSTDGGKTWAAATLPSSADWKKSACGDGTFVAVAYNSAKAVYAIP